MPDTNQQAIAKQSLRRELRQRRAAIPPELALIASQRITARALAAYTAEIPVVSAYWPIGHEIDPRPLMTQLHQRKSRIALPVVVGPAQALLFRLWTPELVLEAAAYGLQQPPPESPTQTPDLLLVPLLAFDRSGARLGYGGGYYDRTLAWLRTQRPITAVGLAFACQEVPQVPTTITDQPLDAVITEDEWILFTSP